MPPATAKQESNDPDVHTEGDLHELKDEVKHTKGKIKGVINDL